MQTKRQIYQTSPIDKKKMDYKDKENVALKLKTFIRESNKYQLKYMMKIQSLIRK